MNRVVVRPQFSLANLFVRGALALLCGLGLIGTVRADEMAAPAPPPRMAKGLIVKLKGSSPNSGSRSIVRLQASAMPSGSAQSLRLRLAAAAHRHRVSYLVQRPTAFAAHLIHSGRQVPLEEAQAEAERLRKDPDVEWVIVNEMAHAAAVNPPNDPAYASQTWLQDREAFAGGRKGVANIASAWRLVAQQPSLSRAIVAVLDTGSLPAQDLDGRMAGGYDMVSEVDFSGDGNGLDSDPSDPGIDITRVPLSLREGCSEPATQWHGLSILAMLGASTNNGLNGAGILAPLPGPVVLPVRVAGMCGAAVSDIIEGMLWAAGVDYQGSPSRNLNAARVINLSFGGDGTCSDQGDGARDAAWLYRQTIQTLESKGVLVVASAGNGDPDTNKGLAAPSRPANCPGVLAVTALNAAGYKANYANLINTATQPGLAVAGGDLLMTIVRDADGNVVMEKGKPKKIYTLLDDGIETLTNTGTNTPTGTYTMRSFVGTSAAAPTVAGVAALVLAVNPSLTVAALRNLLMTQVEPFPAIGTMGPQEPAAVCVAGQDQQGNCICTTSTCGAGILDANRAVSAAIVLAAAASGVPSASTPGYASYFRPDRLACTSNCQSGGGGGGAMDGGSLIALAGLTLLALLFNRQRAA